MTKHTAQACARAGIPYVPNWSLPFTDGSSRRCCEEGNARHELREHEPLHSRVERQCHRENAGYGAVELAPHKQPEMFAVSGYGPSPDEWRSHWRSLPDYDGPPMRAPSGLVVRFPAVEGIDEAERAARRELRTHLRAQGYGLVYLDDDRHDGMRAYRRFGVQMLFDRPDEGGRGWCPKLAGVGE